jgi:hypothetical protein
MWTLFEEKYIRRREVSMRMDLREVGYEDGEVDVEMLA